MAPVGGDGSLLQSKYVFFARPRRFGKTLTISTLEAFFQGDLPQLGSSAKAAFDSDAGERADLFRGTAIEDVVHQTRPHPVVRLNMAMTTSDTPDGLRTRLLAHLESVHSDWCERGAETGIEAETSGDYVRFARMAEGAYQGTPSEHLELLLRELKRQFHAAPVVLIDEYDAPLTHLLGRDMDPEPFIAVLREFFGLLKHLENRLHFVFITGINRFAHVNLFSALNNLTDISWDLDYSALCGFSEEDLQGPLLPYLQTGAGNLGKPVEQVVQELRDHYNGYCFGHPGLSENVYNPYSPLIPIQYDYGITVSAGRSVRVSRIQRQPHSCLIRAGSACQALRIGSRAACLASRVGMDPVPQGPAQLLEEARHGVQLGGVGRRHDLGCRDRLPVRALVAAGPVPDPAVDGRLLGPGSPDAGHLGTLHIRLPGPPQLPRHRIEGNGHIEVGPTDLDLPGHGRPARRPHLAHRIPQAPSHLVAPHDPLPRLQADRGQALPEPPFFQAAWAWGSVFACRGRGTFSRIPSRGSSVYMLSRV